MLAAATAAAQALEHLPRAYRLLALAHAIGMTVVSTTTSDERASTLRDLFDGPVKGALRTYGAADALLLSRKRN